MSTTFHSQSAGIHPIAFIQTTDPSVGLSPAALPGTLWIDTSTAIPKFKKRNAGGTGWDIIPFNWNYTGAWSGATAYAVGDVAISAGSAYYCILAHTNRVPPNATYWGLLANAAAPLTTRGDLLTMDATPTLIRVPLGASGQRAGSNGADFVFLDDVITMSAVVGGGLTPPVTTDEPITFVIDFAATLLGWTMMSKTSGSITLDVKKSTYAGYPGSLASMANAGAKPALATTQKAQDTTLTSWTTTVAAGDCIEVSVNVNAVTLVRATLALKLKRA